MSWISPRRDEDNAKAMGERMADDYEQHLGRPLTADELACVHAQARRVAGHWGRDARRLADRERELGRPLTLGAMTEFVRESNRRYAEEDAARDTEPPEVTP